jgi:hypothetical protein
MLIRFLLPSITMVVLLMLGYQRRWVWRLEWDTLSPTSGSFPHNSHFNDFSFFDYDFVLM